MSKHTKSYNQSKMKCMTSISFHLPWSLEHTESLSSGIIDDRHWLSTHHCLANRLDDGLSLLVRRPGILRYRFHHTDCVKLRLSRYHGCSSLFGDVEQSGIGNNLQFDLSASFKKDSGKPS